MKILHFADLHLGVETYGRADPSGFSSRLLDFLTALDRLVEYALDNRVDLVLFCGDAYKTREPTQTQQREFARRIGRLAAAGIPVFLLTGNHDLPNAVSRATATEIFDTLSVRNVCVSGRPDVYRIATPSGVVQVASLPWLRRSALLGREEARNLSLEEIKQKLQEALVNAVTACAARLDPALPAVLAAHVWVTQGQAGSERSMTIGLEHGILLSNVANPAFDYVALGHLHKQQVLSASPPVVYCGSLERVDFSEEKDEKGYYVVEIGDGPPGKRPVAYEFHPLDGRRFLTIEMEIKPDDLDPTSTVLRSIAEHGAGTGGAIVRVNIDLPSGMNGYLRDHELRHALREAHWFSITRRLRQEARTRLGSLNVEQVAPLDALRMFLEVKKLPPETAGLLLEHAEKLIKAGPG
ncbi:MAG: exonuclease SbcCD subunit D [Chloroflexi bacterium]|nr:exonuclease SbcCD subunit D [Chloroflexota bacterium]